MFYRILLTRFYASIYWISIRIISIFPSQHIFPFPLFSNGLITIHDVLFETRLQYFPTFFKIRSKLFIYPSHAKGFGIPVIESIASDLCTIISETTSLKELGENAAYFINPNQPTGIGNEILELLSDNKLRTKYETLALKRASAFIWDEQAHKVPEIYKSLN